uniref:DUF1614 domain-containing protein n=1 Tax=Desulfobacca acetoxidans TaxID=60893 RepID=A0A7C3UX63_9BACT
MHYFPLALPVIFFFLFLFIALIVLLEIQVLQYAYEKIGVDRRYVFALLLLSLLGSYINIPVYQLPPEEIRSGGTVFFYGVPYIIPMIAERPGTVIAVNLGGAIIPTFLSLYLMVKNRLYVPGLIGSALAAMIFHSMAHPVPGVGIAVPVLVPALVALAIGLLFSWNHAPALAYIVGTLGTLIGADLTNLGKIAGLGAPVASIGGAGTFDGIFLTGILAVLLAGLMGPRRTSPATKK